MSRKAREDEIMRDILVRVGESEHVNQRTLAKELGIALGMTNTYVRRCVRKGLIKISEIPPNRYAYYLTPQGFTEKTRLTAEYLSDSLTFFRRSRNQYGEIYEHCVASGWRHLALAGAGELAEIAILSAREHDIVLQGVIAGAGNGEHILDLPVVAELGALERPDAVIVTDFNEPQAVYDGLIEILPPARVLTPHMLHVERSPEGGA
ncbi:MAG: winged helix-turn-helix transcriptional regulator [Rhodospirillaceae bacterium]|nr:winged helix-turn-helix transcriptional regulator [Rhodospirillaceae bacterium]MBT3629435.1 winged helix-turn-helix transcriptional regulator [Rhodospirillaceae bacterium]MBT3928430.1 winged helix-turn-helix transcriptional regulator [Rhodospirillaceae bacterium]MBT7291690.1 winged helix-turn-helix transcriptional regulator [Rhodospirillaceae bacterium]